MEGDQTCDVCGRSFQNDLILEAHVRQAHGDETVDTGPEAQPLPPDAADDTERVDRTEGGAGRVQTE